MYKLVGRTTAVVAAHAPTPIPTLWAVVSPRFFFFGFAVVLVFFLTGLTGLTGFCFLRRGVRVFTRETLFLAGMLLGLVCLFMVRT
jgi:hypothetical protein